MPGHLSIGVFLCVDDVALRDRLQSALQSDILGRADIAHNNSMQLLCCALNEVDSRLGKWLDSDPERTAAIVVSDRFVENGSMSAGADALFKEFGEKLYVSVALMERPKRILDIDRALSWHWTDAMLARVFQLAVLRLGYLAPPIRQNLTRPIIRPIATETELCNYFKLRHLVYTPMSNLEELVEETVSEMDIDWFDTHAIHIGAFADDSLVGTARLITTESLHQDHRAWTLSMAELDPVLANKLDEAVLALLPVFQSNNNCDEVFHEAMHAMVDGGRCFAELSRVIVHPDCRGAGISIDLVQAAVNIAQQHEVFEMFLECLPIHEPLYRKSGFNTIPNARGSVYGVNKTMAVMHRPLLGSIVNPADLTSAPIRKKRRGTARGKN